MVYVTCMGRLYRLTKKQWLQTLRRIAQGDGYDLNDVGARYLGEPHGDITDMTPEKAKELLTA